MNNKQKVLILKGEGRHEHVLEADVLEYDKKEERLSSVTVGPNGLLTHVDPLTGDLAEHNTIPLEEGTWLVGRQVEWQPFENTISGVFD